MTAGRRYFERLFYLCYAFLYDLGAHLKVSDFSGLIVVCPFTC